MNRNLFSESESIMSYKSIHIRIAGHFTALLLLSATARVADAIILSSPGVIALAGTTTATQLRPNLGHLASL